jgi:hypothetical protein
LVLQRMSKSKTARPVAPELCPVCGEDVPRGSMACPECGADHNSGWREEAQTYDCAGLPEDDFDYNEFVRHEFGGGPKPTTIKPVWWVAAIVLIVVSIAAYLYTAWAS